MASEQRLWKRQREAFWRAHHEAWKRSDLNQRQYCEFHGLPQKAFENWRQSFRLEPEPPTRKLLYRRGRLSPRVSPPVRPGAYPSSQPAAPIVQRPREGHRRRFSEADKRWILQEAARPGASAAEVARRYGVAQRLLRRWKQELTETALTFATVQITDAAAPSCGELIEAVEGLVGPGKLHTIMERRSEWRFPSGTWRMILSVSQGVLGARQPAVPDLDFATALSGAVLPTLVQTGLVDIREKTGHDRG